MKMGGFFGCYDRIDLSSGTTERIPIPEAILQRYLGGVGLGSWLLSVESPPGCDPFAAEAALVFAFSPLVGTPLTTSAKLAVVGKSPLTGYLSDGLSGSDFAIAGKRRGVDALVFVGACPQPSEWVHGQVRATQCWGLSAAATEARLGAEGRVAAIGIAGENLVRFASISNGGRHAGRGGLGAVMGSKRLKAVVIGGTRKTPLSEPGRVGTLARHLSQQSLGEATARYRELGTISNLATFNRMATLPTRNFRQSRFEGADSLSPEKLGSQRTKTRTACANCTIGCEHRYSHSGNSSTRIEYESLFALGPLCGIGDPDAVLAAARRCDELGLDTISAGATVAFAMECQERGLLDDADAPRTGRAEDLMKCLAAMGERRGIGDALAEGSLRLALKIGQDSLDFAPQVKGLEMAGYEPRALQAMALGFAVSTRGADHNRSSAYEIDFSEKANRLHGDARTAHFAVDTEERAAVMDSLILCKFLRGVFVDFYEEAAQLLSAVTGWSVGAADLESVGHRIVNLRKAFNIREGWKPTDDTLPERFFREALDEGPSAGARLSRQQLGEMIRSYNRARGWSPDGFLDEATQSEIARDLALGMEARA